MKRTSVLLIALSVSLAACGGSGDDRQVDAGADDPQAGAADPQAGCEDQAEGSFSWYSVTTPEAMEETVTAFQQQYPDIDIEQLRLASGALATRYAEERAAGAESAGVVTISDPVFLDTGVEEGWFETDPALPALENWPDEFYADGVATVGVVPFVLGYNTNLVPASEVPEEWPDLLDEQWQGKLLMGDPRAASSYLAVAELWAQEYGEDFLSEFAAQNPVPTASSVPASQELAAGGAAFLVPSPFAVVKGLADQGAAVAVTTLSPTTGAEFLTAISTDIEHPCAAELFMNFLLTDEGQEAVNFGGGTSVQGQLNDTMFPLPEGYRPFGPLLDTALAGDRKQELLGLLGLA